MQGGAGISEPIASRGCAFGDFDNDGDVDMVVNPVNDYPQLLRCDSRTGNNWIKVRTIGMKSIAAALARACGALLRHLERRSHIRRLTKSAAAEATSHRMIC